MRIRCARRSVFGVCRLNAVFVGAVGGVFGVLCPVDAVFVDPVFSLLFVQPAIGACAALQLIQPAAQDSTDGFLCPVRGDHVPTRPRNTEVGPKPLAQPALWPSAQRKQTIMSGTRGLCASAAPRSLRGFPPP